MRNSERINGSRRSSTSRILHSSFGIRHSSFGIPAKSRPKKRLSSFLSIGLAAAAALLLSGCGNGSEPEALVFYSSGPRPLAEAASAAFTAETGIPVRLSSATTGSLMAKLEAEKWNPQADVVLFASQIAAEALKEGGRLHPHHPPNAAATPADLHDPEGYYHTTASAAVGIALRASFDAEGLDWSDFFDGTFPGRAVMPSPSQSGSAADFVLAYFENHPVAGWDRFLRARRAGLAITGANNQALGGLNTGAFDAVFAAVDYLVFRQIDRGEPLRMHYPPGGAPRINRPIAILASSPRKETAEKFVDFYLSPTVQQTVADLFLIPARTDIAPAPVRREAGSFKVMPQDIGEGLAIMPRVLRRFQREIERARID
ncbi:MAG: extracellular solute-binding protein [Puniceicoccaceae bacterium]